MGDALKVTIHLDGTGVSFNPFEPMHLDAFLARELAGLHCKNRHMERSDTPERVPLPIAMGRFRGREIWRASAFYIDENTPEAIRHWRKKFRVDAMRNTRGSPNLTNGVYREYNMPVHLVLAQKATAYCIGNRKEIKKIIRRISFFGRKSAQGIGMISGFEIERIDEDWSWIKDGVAMRWLPDPDGVRLVRTEPPYWNSVDRVLCCEVGDAITTGGANDEWR